MHPTENPDLPGNGPGNGNGGGNGNANGSSAHADKPKHVHKN